MRALPLVRFHLQRALNYAVMHLFQFIEDADYTATTRDIVFAVGFGVEKCVCIPILNDECLEEDMETFNVSISSDMSFVTFDVDEISVYIRDDDCELVN